MKIKDKYKEDFKNINPDESFINSMLQLSETKEKTETSEYKSNYTSEYKRRNFIPVASVLIIITVLFTASFVVAALIRKNGDIQNIVTVSEITSQITESTEPQNTDFFEDKQYIITEISSESGLQSFDDNEITETEIFESSIVSESTSPITTNPYQENISSIATSQHYEYTSPIATSQHYEYTHPVTTSQYQESATSENITVSENIITSTEEEKLYQFKINDTVVSAGESAIIEITSDINFEWYIMYAHLFTNSDYIKIKNVSAANKNSIDCSTIFNPQQNSFIIDSLSPQNVNSIDTTIYIEIYIEEEIPAGTYEIGIIIDEATDMECIEFIDINSIKHGKIIVN